MERTFWEIELAEVARLEGRIEGEDKAARKQRQLNESLIAAAGAGHRHVVYLLVRSGADVNARDANMRTALIRAVQNEDVKMVRLLVGLGSDVNMRGVNGHPALHFAIMHGEGV